MSNEIWEWHGGTFDEFWKACEQHRTFPSNAGNVLKYGINDKEVVVDPVKHPAYDQLVVEHEALKVKHEKLRQFVNELGRNITAALDHI